MSFGLDGLEAFLAGVGGFDDGDVVGFGEGWPQSYEYEYQETEQDCGRNHQKKVAMKDSYRIAAARCNQ